MAGAAGWKGARCGPSGGSLRRQGAPHTTKAPLQLHSPTARNPFPISTRGRFEVEHKSQRRRHLEEAGEVKRGDRGQMKGDGNVMMPSKHQLEDVDTITERVELFKKKNKQAGLVQKNNNAL